jgi:hypothetical protein
VPGLKQAAPVFVVIVTDRFPMHVVPQSHPHCERSVQDCLCLPLTMRVGRDELPRPIRLYPPGPPTPPPKVPVLPLR